MINCNNNNNVMYTVVEIKMFELQNYNCTVYNNVRAFHITCGLRL